MTRRTIMPLLVVALAALGGCAVGTAKPDVASAGGSTAPATSPSASAAAGSQGLAFSACMRSHGVPKFPDPNPDGSINRQGLDNGAVQRALPSCRKFLPNSGPMAQLDPQLQEKLRQFAKCMRDNGVNMPDPDPGADNPGLGAMPGVNPNDPAVAKVVAKCQSQVNLPVAGATG
jgi:hypothetical protein